MEYCRSSHSNLLTSSSEDIDIDFKLFEFDFDEYFPNYINIVLLDNISMDIKS
jgi:hypothetical protein